MTTPISINTISFEGSLGGRQVDMQNVHLPEGIKEEYVLQGENLTIYGQVSGGPSFQSELKDVSGHVTGHIQMGGHQQYIDGNLQINQ